MFNTEKGADGVQDRKKMQQTQRKTKIAHNSSIDNNNKIQFSRLKSWSVKTMERPSERRRSWGRGWRNQCTSDVEEGKQRQEWGLQFVVLKEEQQNNWSNKYKGRGGTRVSECDIWFWACGLARQATLGWGFRGFQRGEGSLRHNQHFEKVNLISSSTFPSSDGSSHLASMETVWSDWMKEKCRVLMNHLRNQNHYDSVHIPDTHGFDQQTDVVTLDRPAVHGGAGVNPLHNCKQRDKKQGTDLRVSVFWKVSQASLWSQRTGEVMVEADPGQQVVEGHVDPL